MNRILRNIAILLLITTIGCSNDDGSTDTSASIVGTWAATNVNVAGQVSSEFNNQPFTAPIVASVTNNNFRVTFEDNPQTFTSNGSLDIDGSVSFLGVTYEQDITGYNPVGAGTYEIGGNQLALTVEGETQIVSIERLTDTTLRLFLTTVEDITQDGQEFTAVINSQVTFSRQ